MHFGYDNNRYRLTYISVLKKYLDNSLSITINKNIAIDIEKYVKILLSLWTNLPISATIRTSTNVSATANNDFN